MVVVPDGGPGQHVWWPPVALCRGPAQALPVVQTAPLPPLRKWFIKVAFLEEWKEIGPISFMVKCSFALPLLLLAGIHVHSVSVSYQYKSWEL